MVEFRNVANFDAVWLPRWRRGEVRAYRAKKSKKKVCSDYLFENSCNGRRSSGTFGGYWYSNVTLMIPTSYGVAKSFG